jgi:hypothetical protein
MIGVIPVKSLLLWLLVSLCAQTCTAQEQPKASAAARTIPLRFDSEVIKLFVGSDTLRVEGTYRLICRSDAPPRISLLYPYPADSLLGTAATVLLECRVPGGPWQSLEYEELPRLPAARWRIPMDWGETVEVHTIYTQVLLSRYARYIVTTTQAWGRPLRHARFEIYLPENATPVHFSFPFERLESDGHVFYLYEAEEFSPDTDIIVRWEP